MKILYVAIMYDQGDLRRGYSFEHVNFYESFTKLDGGRHEIIYFPFDKVMAENGKKEMNLELLRLAEDKNPHLLFMGMISDEVDKDTIRKITKSGVVTLGWFSNDQWQFDNYSRFYGPCFSWVATNDPNAIPKYRKINYENAIYTACAANTDIFRPVARNKGIDVSFIGSWNKEREKIIRAIRGAGIRIIVRGGGWDDGRVSPEELVEIISKSKISLNLSPPSFYVGFRPLARLFFKRQGFGRSWKQIRPDFWNFIGNLRAWRQKRIPQLKGRVFEIPACGTMLITQAMDELNNYYHAGEEIVAYKDTADLIEKIKYYLVHDKEREAIAQRGYKRTVRDHTYEKRFRDLFAWMGLSAQ